MLVICEDCAKKYHVDEKRIKAAKAKFSCRTCGHLIVVEKPKVNAVPSPPSPFEEETVPAEDNVKIEKKLDSTENTEQEVGPEIDREATEGIEREIPINTKPDRAAVAKSAASKGRGFPLSFYLLVTMLAGFLLFSGTFTYLYLKSIPNTINHQIELRGQALAAYLKGTITEPLGRKNYLKVSQEVQRTSKLPGVAYAAVRNKKGIVVAGFFSNLNEFAPPFAQKIKEKGFQSDILTKNAVISGGEEGGASIKIGGVLVHDQVTAIPDIGGEIHIGIYIEDINQDIRNILFSSLTLILAIIVLLIACIFFILLDRLVTNQIRSLTNIANRISLGELDLAIMSGGPREMRELGAAIERMRHSIKMAMERITK